ncbi:MAG: CRISPR-associated endonuclease Cas3'' [candidate division WOR-3 bacterium]
MHGTTWRFLAHSPSNDGSRTDELVDHLQSVAERAAEFAESFEGKEEAYLAGLLHDFGKYGELFQQRLRGEAEHIDHWSAGAWLALQRYKAKGLAVALAVQGHHIGLQKASRDSGRPRHIVTPCLTLARFI